MAEVKCPVCGKTGIPDYQVQDTICPQCGADLSIYKLAHDIENATSQSGEKVGKRFVWIIPALIACCLAIALVCTALNGSSTRKELKAFEKENAVLQAKVSELQQAKVDTSAPQPEQSTPFVYTVRRGDSFWLISKRLYGTGTRYREIAESNGMTPESKLNIGDKLIIK
jgi:nucleoid-associated protein YgaU